MNHGAPDRPFILYSDDQWIAVNKPCGLPTHGGDAGDVGVQEWLALHLNQHTFVCSRLDKGTTGVLLLAKTAAASAAAERIHIEERSEKIYYFLSDRDVRPDKGEQWTCDQPLDGKTSRSEIFFDCRIADNVFRYRAVIARGRMHQIRRHAAFSGCPLLGDAEYGGRPSVRIALHCAELAWPDIPQRIHAPLPDSFNAEAYQTGLAYHESLAALERRGCWLSSLTSAWRVIQRGELSEFDLSLDIYGNHALVWMYDDSDLAVLSRSLAPLFEKLTERFGIVGKVFRRIGKNPHKKGLVQDLWTEGAAPAEQFIVTEHDWEAWVTLTQRQHVGLFLDHRDNRRRVQLQARGKRIANLFSYTCAFGVAAAKAGCEVVMNVDASASTLSIGKENFQINALSERRNGKFIEKDVRVWLDKQSQKRADGSDSGWDIIICDPPTFSSTQEGGVFQVSKEWRELAESCARILKPEGVCYFSTNCQAHERAAFERDLRSFFTHVQRLRPPLDFPEVAGRSHAHFFECREPRC